MMVYSVINNKAVATRLDLVF